jgi:hypothetical protein
MGCTNHRYAISICRAASPAGNSPAPVPSPGHAIVRIGGIDEDLL